MKELILHIGMHKTGTTSLQAFLMKNESVLARQGIAVPRFTKYLHVAYNRNGYFLLVGARDASRPNRNHKRERRAFEKDYPVFARAVQENDTVMLSDERFWAEGAWGDAFWVRLKELAESVGVERFKFVLYIRRQDVYALSHWKQLIKMNKDETLDQYVHLPSVMRELDYLKGLQRIEQIFGEGCVVVRPFDRSAFHGGDLYHDFCEAAGIAWDDDFKIPQVEKNPSLSDTVAEIKLWANQNKVYQDALMKSNVLRRPAINASIANPDPEGTSLYSRELFNEMRERYSADNAIVADRYIEGGAASLLEWPAYDMKPWSAQTDVVLSSMVQMFAEALTKQDLKIAEQEKTLQEQAAHIKRLQRELSLVRDICKKGFAKRTARRIRRAVRKLKR